MKARSGNPGAGARIALSGLVKRYGQRAAVDAVSFDIEPGQVVAVTGPSGAGKSTIGRMISGLAPADGGSLMFGDQDVTVLPPQARRVAHMFESYALYPHLTVAMNVESPLRSPTSGRNVPADERRRRVDEVLQLTEIAALRDRLPSQLSGGQKQRVALCRALVQQPSVFVLDEPLGHLDARLRHELRGDVRRRQRALAQGTLWLTPDGMEALAVADRVIVLIEGRVLQAGSPEEIHARPVDVRVAKLIGDPAMNVLRARVGGLTDAPTLAVAGRGAMTLSQGLAARLLQLGISDRLQLGLRPTDVAVCAAGASIDGMTDHLDGEVYAVETLGKYTIVTVDVGGERLRAKLPRAPSMQVGEPVRIGFRAEAALVFDAISGVRVDHPETSRQS